MFMNKSDKNPRMTAYMPALFVSQKRGRIQQKHNRRSGQGIDAKPEIKGKTELDKRKHISAHIPKNRSVLGL